jgi:beta-glucanase (GH16 family)
VAGLGLHLGERDHARQILEIRAKIPTGRGAWPALWLLSDLHPKVRWPRCGEIDLMENVGFDPAKVHFTVHTGAFNHVQKTAKGRAIDVPRVHEDFHVYGLVWTKERIEFFLDGRKVHEFANDGQGPDHWPFDTPFYLLMNLAIGGAWGGQKGIDHLSAGIPHRLRAGMAAVACLPHTQRCDGGTLSG